jgi:hypothetical protein
LALSASEKIRRQRLDPLAHAEIVSLLKLLHNEGSAAQFVMTITALTAFGAMMAIAQAEAIHGGQFGMEISASSITALPRMVGLVTASITKSIRNASSIARTRPHLVAADGAFYGVRTAMEVAGRLTHPAR